MTVKETLINQENVSDYQSQDQFNIVLTKKKKEAIIKARKFRRATVYTPRNDFNSYCM